MSLWTASNSLQYTPVQSGKSTGGGARGQEVGQILSSKGVFQLKIRKYMTSAALYTAVLSVSYHNQSEAATHGSVTVCRTIGLSATVICSRSSLYRVK